MSTVIIQKKKDINCHYLNLSDAFFITPTLNYICIERSYGEAKKKKKVENKIWAQACRFIFFLYLSVSKQRRVRKLKWMN